MKWDCEMDGVHCLGLILVKHLQRVMSGRHYKSTKDAASSKSFLRKGFER